LTLARPTSGGQFLASTIVTDDGGNASYNGLLLVAQHRLSQNFSVLANYTYSHCLDQGEANQDITNMYQSPTNRRAEWGNCASDHRQMFNTSLVVQSPKYGSRWIQRFAGDWRFSSIFTAASAAWLTVTSGTDRSLTGVGSDRPNVVGDWHVSQNTLSRFFDTTAFVGNAPGQYGNVGRSTLPGRANWNLDSALWRTFSINERIKTDLRVEAFNVLNHARFNNPGTTLSNGTTFGVTTSALDPRILQVAMKLTF
jgi:hypothetical protein